MQTLTGTRWLGGPVLAAWPDRKHLGEIDSHRQDYRALRHQLDYNDIAGWLTAYRPTLLAGGDAPAAAPTISDPVVVEDMQTLTAKVNHGNNLAGAMDGRDAVDVLMRLHDVGHRYEPEALYA